METSVVFRSDSFPWQSEVSEDSWDESECSPACGELAVYVRDRLAAMGLACDDEPLLDEFYWIFGVTYEERHCDVLVQWMIR